MTTKQRKEIKNKVQFIMRLSEDQINSLTRIAIHKGISRAKLLEEIITKYLNTPADK